MGVNAAANACEEGRNGEGKNLIIGDVDTGGRGRDVILADGLHGAAKAAAYKQEHDGHADDHDPERTVKGRKLEDAAHRFAAAGDGKVAEADADNFSEGHRDDGEVVAPQPQCRDADGHAHDAGGQAARQNSDQQQR